MDYFHTISALHHKLLDYFTNGIGIILIYFLCSTYRNYTILHTKTKLPFSQKEIEWNKANVKLITK